MISSPSSRYIKLQIQYGSDCYEILLSSQDNHIRVEHILNEIEKLTKVPKSHQTIIYKGQRLDHKPEAILDDLYIFNNSKLILTKTPKQSHDLNINNLKSISFQQQNNNIKTINDNSIIKTQGTLNLPKKQEIQTNPLGFIPESNKTYE